MNVSNVITTYKFMQLKAERIFCMEPYDYTEIHYIRSQ